MDEQRQSRQDMSRMFDTIREMAVAAAKLEKRPTEGETPIAASEPNQSRFLPPPLVAPVPHVPTVSPVVGQFVPMQAV